MRENRHLTRWRLIYYLRVFDGASETLLGHVVDISVEGVMLVSADPIELDREYEVRMVLPAQTAEQDEVRMRMRALWRGSDVNTDFHDTGFRLVDPSQDTIARIQELIEELRFQGPGPAAQHVDGSPSAP